MMNSQKFWKTITPAQSLLMGFILIIIAGTILLTLPIASSGKVSQPLIDALFTATSAITGTGLVIVDTGSFYSLFGQIVILILIQIGGLGYMVFIALIILGFGGRFSFSNRVLFNESLAHPTSIDMIKFTQIVIVFTFVIEFIGAGLLTLYWMPHFSMVKAVYLGIFHSISAFCTAGFGLFPDSLSSYRGSIGINLIILAVCMAGAIGFFVLYDMYNVSKKIIKNEKTSRLSVHSKFVLLVSITLMFIGAVIIFISERGLQLNERLLSSVFQSISASTTTGFNTIDIGAMNPTSLFTIIFLMFVGASPGGTGAGIKTVSFGIILLFLFSLLTGREDVNLFKRRIPQQTINKVFAISSIAILWVVLATGILITTEKTSFLQILFEVVSALGGVGLSTGITSALSTVGKIVISVTMLIGRMGPLAIGFSLVGKPKPVSFKYAEADVLVG
jgi:trk system potassium uptake protein TrkH